MGRGGRERTNGIKKKNWGGRLVFFINFAPDFLPLLLVLKNAFLSRFYIIILHLKYH